MISCGYGWLWVLLDLGGSIPIVTDTKQKIILQRENKDTPTNSPISIYLKGQSLCVSATIFTPSV